MSKDFRQSMDSVIAEALKKSKSMSSGSESASNDDYIVYVFKFPGQKPEFEVKGKHGRLTPAQKNYVGSKLEDMEKSLTEEKKEPVQKQVLLHKAIKQPEPKPRAESPPRIMGKPKKFRAKMAEELDPDMFED